MAGLVAALWRHNNLSDENLLWSEMCVAGTALIPDGNVLWSLEDECLQATVAGTMTGLAQAIRTPPAMIATTLATTMATTTTVTTMAMAPAPLLA